MSDVINKAIAVVIVVIATIIGMTAMLNQAPTVASLTSTATNSALANAGITSSTLAGTVYSFINVFWALAPLLLPVTLLLGAVAKGKGYF